MLSIWRLSFLALLNSLVRSEPVVAVAHVVSRSPTFFEEWSPCHATRGHGKKALVTGITGMLGSHVAEALLEKGYEVAGVVRPRSNLRNVAAFQSKVTLVTAELTDPWRVLRLLESQRPDFIFHFAAQAFNSLSFEQPAETLHTNLMSTLHLLEAMRELKLKSTKIIIAGSSTVYGASTEAYDGPVPEEAPLQPVSPYGVSKAATEMLALSYVRAHGLHVVVPRFFIHLAPRGVESLALHDFARQVAMVERGLLSPPVLRHGDLSTRRDITDIVDSAPVVVCLGEVAPSGTVVNLGSNVSYSMQHLLHEMVRLSPSWGEGNGSHLGKLRLEQDVSRLRAYDERIVMANISKVQQLTGWVPRPNISLLLRMLLDYWRHETAFRFPETNAAPRTREEEAMAEL
ncbi:GDP-6-deoxy-D-mannose reductase [Durusdinium trenchii]|uniref:GDP-6-deoxy-D-mannose reductase n=1 Tax=Durusdinium trenchii TaxID=1381693 RepID=A0ABP0MH79_9DINO